MTTQGGVDTDLADQERIRVRFAASFRYVISQRLLPRKEGGRMAIIELLKATMRTREYIENGEKEGRTLVDAIITFKPADGLTIMFNYDWAEDEDAVLNAAGDPDDAEWDGLAGYVSYDFTDVFSLGARAEYFNDDDGFRLGAGELELWEGTLTARFKLLEGVVTSLEYRHDESSDNELVFVAGHPGRTSRMFTVDHLEYLRDFSFPLTMRQLWRREVQLATSWTDTAIEIVLNQGSFDSFSGLYLHVIGEDGTAIIAIPL